MENLDMTVNNDIIEKVAVCITPQSNSKRLIDKAAEKADQCHGELHVLHVQKGDSIFNNNESLKWLQQLFSYGSNKGGMVHALCDDNIAQCIARFTEDEGITKVVLGELPEAMKKQLAKSHKENQFQNIINALPKHLEVIIVPRNDNERQEKREALFELQPM